MTFGIYVAIWVFKSRPGCGHNLNKQTDVGAQRDMSLGLQTWLWTQTNKHSKTGGGTPGL